MNIKNGEIINLQQVDSTNSEAQRLLRKKKISTPLWIVANEQTSGKGRGEKKWISSKGNLFLSIFFKVNLKKIKIENFLNINANIIKKILNSYSKNKIKIKKPNDLLIKDKIQYAIFSGSVANKHCMISLPKVFNENCITAMQPPLAITTTHALYSQTPRVKGIAKRIASEIDKLITSGKVKELFLASNYSEQEYKDWMKLTDDWLNQNN